MSGAFVISLDFELLWGVRDHADRQSYGQSVLGGRQAIPRMLELFAKNGIRATWATVGFAFCETRDELMASLPHAELRPRYLNQSLSNYTYRIRRLRPIDFRVAQGCMGRVCDLKPIHER